MIWHPQPSRIRIMSSSDGSRSTLTSSTDSSMSPTPSSRTCTIQSMEDRSLYWAQGFLINDNGKIMIFTAYCSPIISKRIISRTLNGHHHYHSDSPSLKTHWTSSRTSGDINDPDTIRGRTASSESSNHRERETIIPCNCHRENVIRSFRETSTSNYPMHCRHST